MCGRVIIRVCCCVCAQALIEALQDKSKRLGEIGDDPLEAAMANARGARGGVGGARIKSYEPDAYAKGTKVNFDDPDDDADQGGPVLQLPATNTSFKLRDLKVLGDVSCVSPLPAPCSRHLSFHPMYLFLWSIFLLSLMFAFNVCYWCCWYCHDSS